MRSHSLATDFKHEQTSKHLCPHRANILCSKPDEMQVKTGRDASSVGENSKCCISQGRRMKGLRMCEVRRVANDTLENVAEKGISETGAEEI